MSYSFKITNGDLTTNGSVLALAVGKDKLMQDVDLWLREIYQVDRFHPTYGSILESFIGNIINLRTQNDITAEVYRVLTNLQNLQLRRVRQNPTKYTPNELLEQVTNVFTQVTFDTITVTIVFMSAAGVVQANSVNLTV